MNGPQPKNGEGRPGIGHDWIGFETSSKKRSWMVTYADIMTIIVTFFVLLLSISTIAEDKFDLLVESLTDRAEGNLQQVKRNIDRVVEKQALGGQVNTRLDEDGLKVEFANALLFESGEATLHEDSEKILEPMSEHLVETLEPHYGITIEGYTDDVPIANDRFDSNWDLSTSRAIDVMKRLRADGLEPHRMSIQGFADTRAATDVDLNDEEQIEKLSDEELEEVRAANRRVVLRINPLDVDEVEEHHDEPIADGEPSGEESQRD